nr:hypothetical protein Q903MT_gene6398 [Picea sitchensis]
MDLVMDLELVLNQQNSHLLQEPKTACITRYGSYSWTLYQS